MIGWVMGACSCYILDHFLLYCWFWAGSVGFPQVNDFHILYSLHTAYLLSRMK